MKNKKLKTLVASLALVGAVAVGATLAYFTDNDAATNVITMGHVDITLTEPNFDKDDGTPDNTINDVNPNQTIVKDPTITLEDGSEDAYVRAKLEISLENVNLDPEVYVTEEAKQEKINEMISELEANLKITSTTWLKNGEYYYCQNILSENDSVTLFESVYIPEEWGNEIADATITINVSAEAIQANNFEPQTNTLGEIIGWNGVTIDTYNPSGN